MNTTTNNRPLAPEVEAELRHFEEEIGALQHGERDPDDFKRFRIENGVYGIRNSTDRHMVRIKIRFGALTAEQLDAIAEAADRYTPSKVGHVTTRQAIQLHNVEQRNVPALLRLLAEAGLTTREACGNTVRNVVCCERAGVAADEVFNVAPYADAVSRYFLRNPMNQNLPRKFKIAFEGCSEDHVRVAIQDLGAVARIQNGKHGFRLLVAGGLGPLPMSAQLLEEFTPAELLIPSIEAVVRLFDRHGNRKDRNRARLKFLLKDWGMEEFRKQWLLERKIVIATRSGLADWSVPLKEEAPPPPPALDANPDGVVPPRWRATNCVAQKQRGYVAVFVRCPLGDITAGQMRGLAAVARQYCGGRLRTTINQNFLLRWVPELHLATVHLELAALGLARAGADCIADITRCPAADTCQLGITHTRGLADALGELFRNGLASDPAIERLSIKMSGCPNSCGHHHIADIGFYGNAKTVDGHPVAHYRVLLGGRTTTEKAEFGTPVLALPAKRIPDALKKLLLHYRDTRQGGEAFPEFVRRMGVPHFESLLGEFATLPPYRERPDLYGDLGIEGEFKVKLGKGECAA